MKNQIEAEFERLEENGSVRYMKKPLTIYPATAEPIAPVNPNLVIGHRPLPKPVEVKTMPCQHCVIGNAELMARNGDLELYECPRCGCHSTMTYNSSFWWGLSFGF